VTEEMEEFNQWGMISKIRSGEKELEAPKIMFVNGQPRFMREKEARVIDLGYLVDDKFGTRAVEVLVGGQEMDLDEIVPHGSIVQFVTTENPSEIDPAQFYDIALPQTKEKMDRQIRIAERNELIAVGRDILMNDLEKRGVLHLDFLKKYLDKFVELENHESLDEVMYLLATDALPIETISDWLNKKGVAKEGLGYSCVLVSGTDEPGILEDVAGQIRKLGGNIEIDRIDRDGQSYTMIILITRLKEQDENNLRQVLSDDKRFDSVRVV
jgi:predicted amino acid-binding ACT domain protein